MITSLPAFVKDAIGQVSRFDWGQSSVFLSYARTSREGQSVYSHDAQQIEVAAACWVACGADPIRHVDERGRRGGSLTHKQRPRLLHLIALARVLGCPIVAVDWSRFMGREELLPTLDQYGVQFLTVRPMNLTRRELRGKSISAGMKEKTRQTALGGNLLGITYATAW